jgi:transposase
MGVQNRRKYDSDFKLNAVLLSQQPGRTVSGVAENLGINSGRIYQWKKAFNKKGQLAFPGNGKEALTELQFADIDGFHSGNTTKLGLGWVKRVKRTIQRYSTQTLSLAERDHCESILAHNKRSLIGYIFAYLRYLKKEYPDEIPLAKHLPVPVMHSRRHA